MASHDAGSANSLGLPRVGVGAVIWRGDEVLLIRRGKPPFEGDWSIPGGGQEPGETVMECALREVREETGTDVEILGLIDVIDGIIRDPEGRLTHHYTLIDFSARWISGEAVAGSDALEAAWARFGTIERYALRAETVRIIMQSAKLHGPLSGA